MHVHIQRVSSSSHHYFSFCVVWPGVWLLCHTLSLLWNMFVAVALSMGLALFKYRLIGISSTKESSLYFKQTTSTETSLCLENYTRAYSGFVKSEQADSFKMCNAAIWLFVIFAGLPATIMQQARSNKLYTIYITVKSDQQQRRAEADCSLKTARHHARTNQKDIRGLPCNCQALRISRWSENRRQYCRHQVVMFEVSLSVEESIRCESSEARALLLLLLEMTAASQWRIDLAYPWKARNKRT